MLNFSQRYQDLMNNLEANVENKKDLEYIKNSYSSLFLTFIEDLQQVVNKNEEKLQQMEENQKQLEIKTSKLESSVQKIEKDIYVNDNYDFEIVCPYCNYEFETELDDLKDQIKCPECNNVIELDWNQEESSCSGNCSAGCTGCHSTFDEEDEEQNEDDM